MSDGETGVDPRLAETARRVFGWPTLRPGQAEAMAAVLAGRDALVVMPTGAGKSAIYQVPALLLDGPTVVVSPLIALQRDQVTALLARDGSGGAVAANSTLRVREKQETWAAVTGGDVEFVFLAPEQLARPEVLERLVAARPSLFVVDEAHCVSAWGHDFRPDYLDLGAVVEQLGHPVVLALTATAAPPVRAEIVERLGLREPLVMVRGFDRPNLRLEVRSFTDDSAKRSEVVLTAMSLPKPGLVYAATRKDTEGYAAELGELGLRAEAYHAGRSAADRERVQAAFMSGDLDVVVATTAFGMGIDKPDVRFVVHAGVPESLDAYYQEAGRAGRDGEPADVLLFYRPEDLGLRAFHASGADEERQVLLQQSRVAMVRGYAETQGCRRQYLLAYFGETLPEPCGNCDACSSGSAAGQLAPGAPWPVGTRLRHAGWGGGLLMRDEGDRVLVLFDEVGYRTLLLSAVAAGGLLEREPTRR